MGLTVRSRRAKSASVRPKSTKVTPPQGHAFKTDLGWMAILGRDGRLARLWFNLPTAQEAREALLSVEAVPRDWNPKLVKRLQDFAAGKRVDFLDFDLDATELAPFTQSVIAACRAVGYGATSNYGDLAAAAGSPRAARAVGNVMRTNRWPIIVPCHRILASGEKLGGYSAPGGLLLKKQLLAMEAVGKRLARSRRATQSA